MADPHDEDSRTATVGRKRPREQDAAGGAPLSAPSQAEGSSATVKRQRILLDDSPSDVEQESSAPAAQEVITIDSSPEPEGEMRPHLPATGQVANAGSAKTSRLNEGFPHLSSAAASQASRPPSAFAPSGARQREQAAKGTDSDYDEDAQQNISDPATPEEGPADPVDGDGADRLASTTATSKKDQKPIIKLPAVDPSATKVSEGLDKKEVTRFRRKETKRAEKIEVEIPNFGQESCARREVGVLVGMGKHQCGHKAALRSFALWLGENAGGGLEAIWISASKPSPCVCVRYGSRSGVHDLKEALKHSLPTYQTRKGNEDLQLPVDVVDGKALRNDFWRQNPSGEPSLSRTFISNFVEGRVLRIGQLAETGQVTFDNYNRVCLGLASTLGYESNAEPPKPAKRGSDPRIVAPNPDAHVQGETFLGAGNETSNSATEQASLVANGASAEGGIAPGQPEEQTKTSQAKASSDEHEVENNTRMGQLPQEDQELQMRYFGVYDNYELVRCLTCAAEGHMSERCPARTCVHCHTRDQHFSSGCPKVRKCTKCRERGHEWFECQSKLRRTKADGFSCDFCKGTTDHVEEDCSMLWRTFNPDKVANLKKVEWIWPYCYECGAARHWGDDCPMRRRNHRVKVDTFSAKQANKYLIAPGAQPPPPNGSRGISIRGRADHPISLDSDDDDDDEMANFFGKKNQPTGRAPRGGIRINAGGSQGGGGFNGLPPRPPPSFGNQRAGNQRASDHYDESQGGWLPPLPDEPPPPAPGANRGGFGAGGGRGGGGGRGRGRGRGGHSGRGGGGGRGRGGGGGGGNGPPRAQEPVPPSRGKARKFKKRGDGGNN